MQPVPRQFTSQPVSGPNQAGAMSPPHEFQQIIVLGSDGSSNGFATAGFVLGIIAMMFSIMAPFMYLICCIVSLPLALLGIIFSHMGYSNAKITGVGKRKAIAGLILNWPQLILGVVPFATWFLE